MHHWMCETQNYDLGQNHFSEEVFGTEGNIESARYHYLLCQNGSLCGRVLIEISQSRGFQSEVDLFLVQAVLQQLSLKDRKSAEDTFIEYTRYHSKVIYFDEQPETNADPPGFCGMFGDIFSRMMQGFDEEDAKDQSTPQRRQNVNELD
ncbi:GL21464 [Drosophila persimilis]|uniref:GL21464 n=1 Tax=Drosophila persimilis TaxID=7234 RepID=B4GDY3_DROPE|nr:GL21464 [Drosophila persimilis]